MTRRRLLGSSAAAVGAAGVGAGIYGVADGSRPAAAATGTDTVAWDGPRQAGIATTPPQAHALFVGLDLLPRVGPAELIGIMKVWTADIARLTQGRPALADTEPELAAAPARLTVTIGYGPGVFAALGRPEAAPAWLMPLPAFSIDRLDPAYTGADLGLQVCSDDPVTVAHAVRVLVKNVRSLVTVRWIQRGFRRARGTEAPGTTMRNLMGQVDGTTNPEPGTADFDPLVWDDGSDRSWMRDGTSMVLRRIRMELDTWDELDRPGRELSVGRTLATGAPLTGTHESDEPDFAATDRNGIPVIPPSAHIARARHTHPGERIFRRVYNYDDPPAPGEVSNSGLLFVSFQRDITAQFVPVQRRLDEFDALNEWTVPVGSAVFAIPPGVGSGSYIGEGLLGR
ncbi:Dyp-type peroxidase [Nocardia flavorosea]|uniref:Dyp-type peroxidase n=1 Tax=Nocardia flavorosea TaxID=53429 RepID=UPI0018953BE2|nr:Dyp-type peroxidase [Nocardia flavorosea]MBF6352183.1 Dyp-type peroxidase [Nocardia flavorosea]